MMDYKDECVDKMTGMHVQAFLGDEAILGLAEEKLNQTDGREQTVIHYAALGNAAELIKKLHASLFKKVDSYGRTGLVLAARRGNAKAAEILAPAEHGIHDEDGKTAL